VFLHGAAKCAQCTHMAGKELKFFLFYTDVLSCRVHTSRTSRATAFSQANLKKKCPEGQRTGIRVTMTHNLAAIVKKFL